MNIDERFEKLEKQIKTLKRMLGGVAALALAALVGGTVMGVHAANGTFDTITAKTLILIDSSGKQRAKLKGSTGTLSLSDSSGKYRAYLSSSGSFYLKDANGKERVNLSGKTGKITAATISAAHTHSYSPTSHKHTVVAHKPKAHTHSYSSTSHKHTALFGHCQKRGQ